MSLLNLAVLQRVSAAGSDVSSAVLWREYSDYIMFTAADATSCKQGQGSSDSDSVTIQNRC